MTERENQAQIYGYLVAGLLGALMAIFIGMVTFGRNVITRTEMEDYVEHHSPYSEDKARIDQIMVEGEKRDSDLEVRLQVVERNQQRVMQKLGMIP